MKFNFIGKGKAKWYCSRELLIAAVNFIFGFVIAWLLWSGTFDYILAMFRS